TGAHPYLVTPGHTRWAREILGDGPLLAPEQMAILETDPARAREIARGALHIYLQAPNYVANLRRMGFTGGDIGEASGRLGGALGGGPRRGPEAPGGGPRPRRGPGAAGRAGPPPRRVARARRRARLGRPLGARPRRPRPARRRADEVVDASQFLR